MFRALKKRKCSDTLGWFRRGRKGFYQSTGLTASSTLPFAFFVCFILKKILCVGGGRGRKEASLNFIHSFKFVSHFWSSSNWALLKLSMEFFGAKLVLLVAFKTKQYCFSFNEMSLKFRLGPFKARARSWVKNVSKLLQAYTATSVTQSIIRQWFISHFQWTQKSDTDISIKACQKIRLQNVTCSRISFCTWAVSDPTEDSHAQLGQWTLRLPNTRQTLAPTTWSTTTPILEPRLDHPFFFIHLFSAYFSHFIQLTYRGRTIASTSIHILTLYNLEWGSGRVNYQLSWIQAEKNINNWWKPSLCGVIYNSDIRN